MIIKQYDQYDYPSVLDLIISEGEEWVEYALSKKEAYQQALHSSITFIMMQDDLCIGYIRCRDDDGFGIYVYDLLVHQGYRGHHYGKMMIDHVKSHYPEDDFYIMSDVDPYYIKQGYERIGSIFQVKS